MFPVDLYVQLKNLLDFVNVWEFLKNAPLEERVFACVFVLVLILLKRGCSKRPRRPVVREFGTYSNAHITRNGWGLRYTNPASQPAPGEHPVGDTVLIGYTRDGTPILRFTPFQ